MAYPTEDPEEDPLAQQLSGISSPERKGRKISPRSKKQLDYKHQMRRGVDGEDIRKYEKVGPRLDRQHHRRVLNRVTQSALEDDDAASGLADALHVLKRSRIAETRRVKKVPLGEAIDRDKDKRDSLNRDPNQAKGN